MQNYLMKCPSCKVILLYLILMVTTITSSSEGTQGVQKLYVAKRNFLSRERNYLKAKPISNDLKTFINRYKRRTLRFWGKNKREDDLKEHVFVVNNGNIERLENLSDVTANVPSSDPSGLGNFTVIPLIIPVTVKTFTNATFCNNVTQYSDDDSTESMKFEKITDYDDEGEMFTKAKHTQKIKKDITTSITKSNLTTTTEVIVDDSTSTKSQNMKFLNKVLSDVQELISYEKEGKPSGSNEGAMCTVMGDWDSKAGGMQLQITAKNESLHSPSVQLAEQEPDAESGFLKTEKWNITTLMPFNHSSLIMMTAVSERTVATFLGDCRICEGSETITGNWMLMVKSSNCKDRHNAHSFFSDVMRKSNIRRLQKAHMEELSTKDLVSTTEL